VRLGIDHPAAQADLGQTGLSLGLGQVEDAGYGGVGRQDWLREQPEDGDKVPQYSRSSEPREDAERAHLR